MSRWLIGSISKVIPCAAARSAAPEVSDIDRGSLAAIRCRGPVSGHGVKLFAAERERVFERAFQTGHEFALASRQGRHAALALAPIARRQVEKHLSKAVPLETGRDVAGREIIGKEKLDASETCRCCRRKTVEEAYLLEHHAQIGCEFRHAEPLPESGCLQGRHLLVREQADLGAAQKEEELCRFLELFDGIGGSIEGT